MKINCASKTVLGVMMAMSLSLLAHADVTFVNYNLSVPSGDLGASQYTYGATPYQLPINGVKTNDAPDLNNGTWTVNNGLATNLYGKNSPGDPGETGLGMAEDPLSGQHEIWDMPGKPYEFGFLQVDITNILNNPNLLYFHMRIGSAQDHEWFTIWGSTAANPNVATLLMISGAPGGQDQSAWFDVPNFRDYSSIWVGAIIEPGSGDDHSNVVLESEIAFDQNPIPEPGTLALLGSGIVGIAGMLRRKFVA